MLFKSYIAVTGAVDIYTNNLGAGGGGGGGIVWVFKTKIRRFKGNLYFVLLSTNL